MTRSKALKSLALLEAQAAVKFDNEGLLLEALEAYSKAVTLLEMVMKSTTSPEEYDRLLAISININNNNNINNVNNVNNINNADNTNNNDGNRSLQPA
ncbi:hypothetical protein BGZ47_007780 [Haplosporangium gracile]|nr:hypothetical protein BGZ47_007780 [Haplosporangium gracile]